MSVREYSFDEIEAIYGGIQGLKARMLITPKGESLQNALRAAYYANRAALGCSYNEDMKLLRCALPGGFDPNANVRDVYKDIGLLLYNCVTNGGRDFMPERDRNVLETVQREIAWYLIDRLPDKGVKP